MRTKTARARGKVRAQYRWAYATSTSLPLQEIGKNQHEKGGWAYNTSWAYNTYSTVHVGAGAINTRLSLEKRPLFCPKFIPKVGHRTVVKVQIIISPQYLQGK